MITLPNAILIGVQKGGTTALYDWLAQHPDIYGDLAMKDFPFFCEEGFSEKGLDWFAHRYSGHRGERVILHGYVNYLSLAGESAALIHQSNPAAKVFAVLRNPCERAYSAYLQARKMGRDPCPTFRQALEKENQMQDQDFSQRMDHSYIGHGFYTAQIRAFAEYFPKEQMRFVLFEDLLEDPVELCRNMYEFLGVSTDFSPTPNRKNDHAEPKSTLIQRAINYGIPITAVRNLIPVNQRIRIRRFLHEQNMRAVSKPDLDPEMVEKLKAIYSDEIELLEAELNRDLSSWKDWQG